MHCFLREQSGIKNHVNIGTIQHKQITHKKGWRMKTRQEEQQRDTRQKFVLNLNVYMKNLYTNLFAIKLNRIETKIVKAKL